MDKSSMEVQAIAEFESTHRRKFDPSDSYDTTWLGGRTWAIEHLSTAEQTQVQHSGEQKP